MMPSFSRFRIMGLVVHLNSILMH